MPLAREVFDRQLRNIPWTIDFYWCIFPLFLCILLFKDREDKSSYNSSIAKVTMIKSFYYVTLLKKQFVFFTPCQAGSWEFLSSVFKHTIFIF